MRSAMESSGLNLGLDWGEVEDPACIGWYHFPFGATQK